MCIVRRFKMTIKHFMILLSLSLSFSLSKDAHTKEKKEDPPLTLEFEAPKEAKKKKKGKMTKAEKELSKSYKKIKSMLNECTIEVADIEDRRQNKVTIGSTPWKPLKLAPIHQWLSDASDVMLKSKLRSDSIGVRHITIEPKITRLYSYAQNLNLHGVTALHVDFRENGKIVDSRHYRGFGSTINWNFGDHEFLDAVNTSMKETLTKLLFDLPSFCSSEAHKLVPHKLK